MKKPDFKFLDDAQEDFDVRVYTFKAFNHDKTSLHQEDSTEYVCGLCNGKQTLLNPCVHHPGVEVK